MNPKPRLNRVRSIAGKCTLGMIAAVCCLFFGCEYEVPITANPTRKIEEKLLGNWTSNDGKEKMKVRKFDDFIYIVSYDGDLFRAYHSDVAKTPFVSVQDIDSVNRRYAYMTWKLSEDGKLLGLRVVSNKVIPKENKDSASIQKLLEENLQNPALFEDEVQFIKEK